MVKTFINKRFDHTKLLSRLLYFLLDYPVVVPLTGMF